MDIQIATCVIIGHVLRILISVHAAPGDHIMGITYPSSDTPSGRLGVSLP